jgi:hypothetical protein
MIYNLECEGKRWAKGIGRQVLDTVENLRGLLLTGYKPLSTAGEILRCF